MTKTTARKKRGEAGAAAALGAALALVAVWNWSGAKGVAFWAGLFALGLLVGAAVGFREADCPSCARPINFAASAGYVRCRHCRRYARAAADGFEGVAEDFVAPTPVFGIPIKEDSVLPAECCVCRAPATGKAAMTVKLDDSRPSKSLGEGLKKNAALGAGLRPALEVRLDIPHCAAHQADARIEMDRPLEGLFDAGSSVELVVRVRSYPYYRAALGL
jgi:hypothetical protein